jgi:hypothetical protein
MNRNEVVVEDLRYYANICFNRLENHGQFQLRQSLSQSRFEADICLIMYNELGKPRKRGPWLILSCLSLHENTLRWKGGRQCTQWLLNWGVRFGLSFSQKCDWKGNKLRNYDCIFNETGTRCMWLPVYHTKRLAQEMNGSFQGLILVYSRVLKNCDPDHFTF